MTRWLWRAPGGKGVTATSEPLPWLRWRHREVRDLAWVIGSPPLLTQPGWPDSGDCRHWLSCSQDWLATLDADPAALLGFLAEARDHRLGHAVERLLCFWLSWPDNPCYRLVAHQVAIREDGRTLGELDFVVRSMATGQLEHWEIAVKFFLGIAPGGRLRDWVGPGLRDRLDLKVARLLTHQLPLARTPRARAVLAGLPGADGDGLSASRALVKGCLFYPLDADLPSWQPHGTASDHLHGWWATQADFLRRFAETGLAWSLLPKAHWLTPLTAGEAPDDQRWMSPAELIARLSDGSQRAVMAVIGCRDGREVTRGFVAPAGWPAG